MQKLSKLVSKQRKLQEKCDKNVTYKTQIEKWSHMRLLLRYIEMCQLPHINNHSFPAYEYYIRQMPRICTRNSDRSRQV